MQTDDSDRGGKELRAVVEQEPDSFMARNALGLALENLGAFEAACEQLNVAVKLNPRFALGYYNLAHVATTEKRFSAAVFYLQKAVSLDAQEPAYQLALGIAYSEDGKIQKSVDVLQKLIASYPNFIEAYLNLGTVCGRQKRFQEAVRNYRQALKLDTGNLETLLSLGIALLANGQANQALGVLKTYIGRQPRDFQGYYWLCRAYKDLARSHG